MPANGVEKLRLGDMLLAADLINQEQLALALAEQEASGMRLGKQLVQLGHVSEVQVTQTLSNQLSIPWVSIAHVEFSTHLLQRVPAELADRHSLMPIYVRSVRGQGDTLYVAMDDPTDDEALEEVTQAVGMPVRPMVASPSDIRTAIERRYFGAADSQPPRAPRPGSRPPTGAGAQAGEGSPTGTRQVPPPPSDPRRPVEVPLEMYAKPSEPPKAAKAEPKKASGPTLTFLDGTTLAMPKPSSSKKKANAEIREVRHLMKSILVAQKLGAAGGPPAWDEVLQVLLDVAHDRGVAITRKEFAQAWLRHRGS